MKIAIPTKGRRGLRDIVSNVFARAPTFTIINFSCNSIKLVEIIENEAAGYSQGTGPLVANMLKENKVETILCGELGPGALNVLETAGIKVVKTEIGIQVKEALESIKLEL